MAFLVPRSPLAPWQRLAISIDPAVKVISAEELYALRSAEQIIKEAQAQAQQVVKHAEESFESERQRGFNEGMEEARLEQAEKMIENISQTIDYFSKVEGKMVDLVMQAVRKIIDDFADEERVLIAVKNALSVVRHQKHMTLRVNAQQVEAVKARVNEILAAYPGVGYLDIVPDSRLKVDACIVESEIGTVEASVDGQLEALRASFLKVLGSRI
ncbi:MAG: type secretion system protein [Proteobacteria bacterium]|nr:type secretion system protein [Pseudomonadota bacterium]